MPNLLSRQKLSQPDLIALLNWELAAYEECDGCRFTAIEARPGNWEAAVIANSEAQRDVLEHVLAETREQFDVALPVLLPRQVA
jgi:hypothetical protein